MASRSTAARRPRHSSASGQRTALRREHIPLFQERFMGEPESKPSLSGGAARAAIKAAPVIIVGSVMFSFISYWRVAAVVLCDLASTAFYIGGVVEQANWPAAPWFILAVLLFSYAVGSLYIESCSLYVRGGV